MSMLEQDILNRLQNLKSGARELRKLSAQKKSELLLAVRSELLSEAQPLLEENKKDLAQAHEFNSAFIDRLTLSQARIEAMAESLKSVADLKDPVGEIVETKTLANQLLLKKVRSPLGVLFMIFESRPNVALEAFSMAFKSGNAIILRGGKESQNTVRYIYKIILSAFTKCNLSTNFIWGIEDSDRNIVNFLLKQKQYIDVVVPRGGEKLIEFVQENASMPIIKNDRGLCHVYVHEDADLEMATQIVCNAKLQRPSVCNSMETLLVHASVAEKFLPQVYKALDVKIAKLFVCEKSFQILKKTGLTQKIAVANTENYNTEYLDYIMNIKLVASLNEAIEHIEKFGSKHSESIITKNENTARLFQTEVDAAAVYWNASTRFTDGFEFGLGGELGISTQKLHVRGPVGLRELTSLRWVIDGTGQVR